MDFVDTALFHKLQRAREFLIAGLQQGVANIRPVEARNHDRRSRWAPSPSLSNTGASTDGEMCCWAAMSPTELTPTNVLRPIFRITTSTDTSTCSTSTDTASNTSTNVGTALAAIGTSTSNGSKDVPDQRSERRIY